MIPVAFAPKRRESIVVVQNVNYDAQLCSMYSHRNFSINDLPCASQDSIESNLLLGHTDIAVREN